MPEEVEPELDDIVPVTANRVPNAWAIQIDPTTVFDGFSIPLTGTPAELDTVEDGDGILVVASNLDGTTSTWFARLYRKHVTLYATTLYFEGALQSSSPVDISTLGIEPLSTGKPARLGWLAFADALRSSEGIEFEAMPAVAGATPAEQSYLRDLLQRALTNDLLGPANGPYEEVVGMSVRDRYLVGKLAPQDTVVQADQDEDLPSASGKVEPDEGDRDAAAATNQSLIPSSFGLTFCVDGGVEAIEVEACWGRYERGESETQVDEKSGKPIRAWKRIPSGGKISLSLAEGVVVPTVVDASSPSVVAQGIVRPLLENGDRLVTLFLVNTQTQPQQNQDVAWVFQPELIVRHPEQKPVFHRRPVLDADGTDMERESLEMIYRKRVEFAVGHGISVHATTMTDDVERAVEIRTVVLPDYEVSVTETPGSEPEDRPAMRAMVDKGYLDMEVLAGLEYTDLAQALSILTDDYEAWIGEQRARIGSDVVGFDAMADSAMDRCDEILIRLRKGIAALSDDKALAAFRFANCAMALQRIRSMYALRKRRGDDVELSTFDIRRNRSWRPFQLAFVLLSIPALLDPLHTDRTEPVEAFADLLWFPTGGGKTEAYLGVAAFCMAVRRLQGTFAGYDGTRGLAVIMRYTLRLLTLQQFQRATALLCAMETIRRTDVSTWGETPFTVGLWVGQRVTPNTTEDSHAAIEKEREGKYGGGSTPAQLTSCPWCGCEIVAGRDIVVLKNVGKTVIYCGDKLGNCDFSRTKAKDAGLPVVVVDQELYHRPPTMLIATVDKFAMMAWRGEVRTLCGFATAECPRHGLLWPDPECSGNHPKSGSLPATQVRKITRIRPPDLIIQDEFHLISGPLGTMVGLYETAVDALSTWRIGDKAIRPKVIASTATVRKATEQVHNVFLRRVSVFPPSGLDVEDNFFSVQRSTADKPGRRYLGICSPGSSRPAVLIRLYVALLTAAQELFQRFGTGADPYMTVVGYFNSLRELGGMRRLAEDDVQTRAYRVAMSRVLRPGLAQRSVRTVDELTSRVSSKDIPKKLDLLEVKFKKAWAKGEPRAIDVVLATNMLSVGVDVNRLGLMAVNGQPKSTAEYIQATSRVGRAFPGLVCTVLTWSRPRDLSHYETFEHYHATFYKHVEAQSVTPFAPRALDRGLTGALVSLLRLPNAELNPNLGAEKLDSTSKPEVGDVQKAVAGRAWKVTDNNQMEQVTSVMAADRLDRWVKEASKGGRELGYEREYRKGTVAALLKKPGVQAWDEVTVPMSMREVEPGVRLVMDTGTLPDAPAWRVKKKTDDAAGGKS